MGLPQKVFLTEVGPRDGFQFETKIMPADFKTGIIEALADAGLKRIQVVSFVNPKRVPQMADAGELVAGLSKRRDTTYTGLVLNRRGLGRAKSSGLTDIEVSISASDTHGRRNAGMSLEQAANQGNEMIRLALDYGMNVTAGIQCAFGCVYEGTILPDHVMRVLQKLTAPDMARGIDRIAISDTTGMATPIAVKALLKPLCDAWPDVPVALHLHDTRGLGLVNLMAAMECGITEFDTSLAGMGGCPFVDGAAGNIATEDTAYLLESLNIETGIDIAKVAACSVKVEDFLGKHFPGKMHRILSSRPQ